MTKISPSFLLLTAFLAQTLLLGGCGALDTAGAVLDAASSVDNMAYTNDDIEFGRKPASYSKMQFQMNMPQIKAGDKIGQCYVINRSGRCNIRHIVAHESLSDQYDCRDSKNLTGKMLTLVEGNKCD